MQAVEVFRMKFGVNQQMFLDEERFSEIHKPKTLVQSSHTKEERIEKGIIEKTIAQNI